MGTIVKVGGGLASAGAGKGLYYVELPRSKFYGDVAEWVTTNTVDPIGDSLQIVCNGELWIVHNEGIQSRSLATKQITYSESGSYWFEGYKESEYAYRCNIATDGESRIWFTAFDVKSTAGNKVKKTLSVYEYNVLTHTMLRHEVFNMGGSANGSNVQPGLMLYSSAYNRVYVMGCGGIVTGTKYYNWFINLSDYTTGELGDLRWGPASKEVIGNCYTYEDENGYIYFGDGATSTYSTSSTYLKYNTYIYRLNPYDNTLTTIRTDFDDQLGQIASFPKAYFTIGETIYIMNTTNVMAINPKTGDFVEGEMPLVLGDPVNSSMKAIYNNTVYIVQDVAEKTMVECTFYADSPPLAPIVAKIYKGQKFHSIVPFKLLRQGIEVTTVQQTATEDIEVKMYDYSSEGGQLLYIET